MNNKFELKEMRWNMNNEVDNVISLTLSLATLQAGQKLMLHFLCLFVYEITICWISRYSYN